MNVALFAAVAVACVGGAFAAFVLGNRAIALVVRRHALDAGRRETVVKSAAAFGLVAVVPAVLLGIVIGGTLGAAHGPVGIALGTFAVVTVLISASVAAGAWVGRLLADRADL